MPCYVEAPPYAVQVKNAALKEAGCHVPSSFDDIGELLCGVYCDLVRKVGRRVPALCSRPRAMPVLSLRHRPDTVSSGVHPEA